VFEGGNYFRNPALLEFVAENPVRHGVLPANIVSVAREILEAGAEPEARDAALGLVATGRVPRECGVQVALIELLCAAGADRDGPMLAAAVHGEFEAVEALIRLGAKVDLSIAAALGRAEEFARLLPAASAEQRHLALALAAQFGRLEIVRALLDAAENPDRYNPAGAHGHSTPLHQAALAGHVEVVRLLADRGARLDLKDTVWGGTPENWARHNGKTEVADYLREQMS
jgi:ankyrin repeat protein